MFDEIVRTNQLLKGFTGNYWIAGGWAVDLFLGRKTRAHKDIEIAIPRDEQQLLWKLDKIRRIDFMDHGIARAWNGTWLDLPVHQLRCHFATSEVLDVLLNEFDANDWLYRRNRDIRRSRHFFLSQAGGHLPIEVVMLFKSKHLREIDQDDFTRAVAVMDHDQKIWLRNALQQTASNHPWLTFL